MAARNVLLTHDFRAKIADFGLATRIYRDVNERKRYETSLIPLYWTAYEVLTGNTALLEKSDVWSFAVFMWEVFQLCSAKPFGQNQMDSKDLTEMLDNGQRLGKPLLCPQFIYEVMLSCWNLEPSRRPSFQDLKIQLDTLIVEAETLTNDKKITFLHQRSVPDQIDGNSNLPITFVAQNQEYLTRVEVHQNGYVNMSRNQNDYVPLLCLNE